MLELAWLPDDHSWAERVRACEQEPSPTWRSLVALANVRLDFVQVERLGRLLARAFPQPPPELASQPVRLAMLGSSTLSQLVAAVRVAGLRRGLWVDVWEAPYGQYRQALASDAAARFNPTATLLALDARHLTAGLPADAGWADADRAFDRAMANVTTCWREARARGDAVVLQQTVLPVLPSLLGENEFRLPGSRARLLARINSALPAAADAHGVHLVSVHAHAAQSGVREWHDPVLWLRAKQEVSPAAAPAYGDLVCRVLAATQGWVRKALVLDLDNTLWGGVVGDDGVEGLELGQGSAEGEAFAAVQDYARRLSARGVVLAVCSKNDEAIALNAFENHPEMVLRRSDVTSFVANWDDKATNLRRIARELNLGLDALVFLDDNPFERELVREALPEVAVPEIPNDDPALVPQMLADAGYFEALALTAEDAERTAQYQSNRARASAEGETTDLPSYLRGLDMRLVWRPFDEAGLSRIVQLVNKTNQFNLTTLRTTAEQSRRLMDDPAVAALQFRLLDRFGDNGMIGVVVLRREADAGRIETWLMSCRVLGRGVEEAMLVVVADAARALGCRRLLGEYRPSAKNAMVAGLYSRLGFSPLQDRGASGGTSRFELQLEGSTLAAGAVHVERGAST